jgi:rare lipoprotein A
VPLSASSVQSETLAPVRTTPAIHQELLKTEPVPEYVQLPVTGNHRLFIQAGAFAKSENATRLQQNLSRLGNASVSTIAINGTTFYRVRLGPVADVAGADALLAKVKQAGAAAARTVVD